VSDVRKRDRAGVWPFAMTLVVLAAIILGGGTLYYREQERSLRASVDDQLAAVADLKVHELVLWRTERIIDVQHFKDNAAFAVLVGEYFARPDDPAVRAALLPWLERMVAGNTYDEIVLVDASGAERLRFPASAGPLCASVRSELPAIMRSDSAAFVDFHRDDTDGRVRIALVQPVIASGPGSPAVGAIVLRIDPAPVLYPFIQRWPVPSDSAETLLVRREGDMALFLNDLRFDPKAAVRLTAPLTATRRLAVKAVLGEAGLVTGLDYREVPALASIGPIPGSPWFLIAKVDESEAYAPVRRQLLQTALLVAALLGVATTGVAVAWRQRRASLLGAQLEAERESAWLRDVIARSLNEVYVFDPLTLRYTFANNGALRNIGYTQDELATMTPLDIKPEFNEESFRALLAPMLSGDTESVEFETTHRRKDGTDYPAEIHLQFVDTGSRRVILAIDNDITARHAMQEELRESEDKFKYVFDHSAVAKSITRPTGEIQPNDAFCDLLGYTHEELADKATWMQVSHPGDIASTQAHVAALLSGACSSARFDKRYLRKDGSVVWADVSTSLRCDVAGRPQYFVTTIADVTERKTAEAELKAVSSRNEAILAAVPEIIAEVDANKVYTWLNKAGREFFGDDAAGHDASDYFLGEQETYFQVEPLFIGTASAVYVESWQRRRDGERRLLAWWCRVLTDESGAPAGALSTARDITEERAAEERLRETTAYLENLLDYANAPIIVWDTALRITRFNRAFEELTGLRSEDVVGKKLDVLFPKGRVKESLAHVTAASAGERWEVVEIPVLRTDGTVRTVLWNSATVFERDGDTPQATIAQGQDITERKAAEEELRKHRDHLEQLVQDRTEELDSTNEELTSMNEELTATNEEMQSTNEELVAVNEELAAVNEELAATNEELEVANVDLARMSAELVAANRAKSEFLASMSHELRTPLNSIIGFSNVMMRGMAGTLSDEQDRQIAMINESGIHLLSLINDILDLSRIESGRLELRIEELQVRDVVRQAAETIRPLAEQRGLALTIEVADECSVVRADSRSLHQILLNLLGNAVKFTKRGGVTLRALCRDGDLRLEVTDTGIGIDPSRLDDIFDEFRQYEQPGVAKPEGAGLGLPVSRRLAERLGGRIEVESLVGVGSTFTLVVSLGQGAGR
jgi:PAS domain S-box-containing protein